MKFKKLFLTLITTILCTTQAMGDIQDGYYYLKFGHSSVTPNPALYLSAVKGHDSKSLGSTQEEGSVFYIQKGSTGYTFKAGSQYLGYSTWMVTFPTEAQEWPVEEVDGVVDAYYIKGYNGGYLGNSNSSNFAAGKSVFSNAGKTTEQGANYWILEKAKWPAPAFTDGHSDINTYKQYLQNLSYTTSAGTQPIFSDATAPSSVAEQFVITSNGIDCKQEESVTIIWNFPSSANSSMYLSAYADFNGDGDFDDANEKIGVMGTFKGSNNDILTNSIQFTVPATATVGTTRIRLRFDSSWNEVIGSTGSYAPAMASTNRMVYDIPVTISTSTPTPTSPASISAMLDRIGGTGASSLISSELDESIAEGGKEVYIITLKSGKPHVKGSTLSAISAGIGYYLNHYAKVNLTWNNLTTNLSAVTLPVPESEDKHVCSADYRYYLNYCTFSYSMSTWGWDRWQKEIDWMALHGINLPLQLVGIDAVWYKVLTEDYSFTHDEANAFVAGPCYQGWWLMNNIVAHGGPNPTWWYEREATLGKQITDRMRELGMNPCLPGFVGMVPEKLATAKGAQVHTGSWCSMSSPQILKTGADDNTKRAFAEIADKYYTRLYEIYGFKPDYYSLDPMHEREASQISDYSDANYKSICDEARKAMNVGREENLPVWVAQEWQVNAAQSRINALPNEKTLLLDLSSERETYKTRFTGKNYVFCMLHNYGGNIGMYGCIDRLLNEYSSQRANYTNLKGIGATPEGIETNPVLYELLFELPWLSSVPNATNWLNEYTEYRYNATSDKAKSAWNLLHNTVYNQNSSKQQGCVEPVILARPNLRGVTVSRWSQSTIDWNKEDVQRAAWEIAEAEIPENINYNYDLVDITRQALADYAHSLQIDLGKVKDANGISSAEFTSRKTKYMNLIDDTDELLGTIEDFRLGRWLSSARQIAIDAGHSESADWLEKNARWLITTWAPTKTSCNGGNLYDYGNREYQGLITGYYKPRWTDFFENKSATEQSGDYWFDQEIKFVNGESVAYGTYQGGQATGNVKATAQRILGKYIYRITNAQGDVAYLNAAMVNNNKTFTDNATLGTPYSPNITLPEGVTITSANLSDDQTPGLKKATLVLSDGTIATYNVALRTKIDEPRTVSVVISVTGGTAVVEAEGATPEVADGKQSVSSMYDIVATATAADGYEFDKWINESDEEVSKDNPYYHYAAESIALTPVFVVSKWTAVECLNNGEFSTMTSNKQYIAEFATIANDEEYSFFSTTEAPEKYYMIVPSVVQLVRGVNNTVKWTAADQQGQNNGMQACRFNGYIDINSDGDFTDDGEYMPTKGSYKAQNSEMHSASVSFLIPESSPLGRTRMRLRYDGAWQGDQFKMEATAAAGRMVYDVPVDIVEYPYYPVNVGASSSNKDLGTIRVDGGAFNNQNPAVIAPGSTVILLAEPVDGSTFLGWKNTESGEIESTELRWEFRPKKDLTYLAVFADNEDDYFYKGEGEVHVFDIRDISSWSALKKQYPWTITMKVVTDGLKDFNDYGSVAIADGSKATSDRTFQIYMAKDGNLDLNLGGTAHTGISCKQDFMFTLKYDGSKLYLYAKGKDAQGNDKEYGANDGASFTVTINDFTQLSCALPEGVNIKTLTITSEEELNYATDPKKLSDGANYVDGNGQVQLLKAKYYITNKDSEGDKKYSYVPEGKAWQMVMDVTHAEGQKNSYNKWGSCILASEADPINTYYWNNFQVYEHAVAKGTLNFKSNKGDGNDHIIAQGYKVGDATNGYEDYRVIVRYDGGNVYLIRTIILDKDGNIKKDGNGDDMIFNNVWFAARVQHDIDVMSCALPTDTNIKSLSISIAEESNLLEDVDYAIQNTHTSEYLSCDYQRGPEDHYFTADHASKFKIEFTNNNDLAFHDGDGGLHPTIYIKAEVFNEQTRTVEWKYLGLDNLPVDDKADAIPYLYSSNSMMIEPINNTGTGNNVTSSKGTAWKIGDYDKWNFVFFGNYLVQVADNTGNVGDKVFGGITYKRQQTRNNGYIALPVSAKQNQIPNTSEVGYSTIITMDGTMLRLNYTPLENTFYNITDLSTFGTGTTLYYWYKDRKVNDTAAPSLITYSTTNTNSGNIVVWNAEDNSTNLFGDCTKYSITQATTIPMKVNGMDGKYYGSVYCPNALALPEGVTAYRLHSILQNGNYLLKPIDGQVLPAMTAAVLISGEEVTSNPSGNWSIDATNTEAMGETNLFAGVLEHVANPGYGQQTSSTVYTLGGKKGVGFYPYSGANIPAFKAYHQIEMSASLAPASYFFDFDEETGIVEMHMEAITDGKYYDLTGRQVQHPTAGALYIHNGKKVLF